MGPFNVALATGELPVGEQLQHSRPDGSSLCLLGQGAAPSGHFTDTAAAGGATESQLTGGQGESALPNTGEPSLPAPAAASAGRALPGGAVSGAPSLL